MATTPDRRATPRALLHAAVLLALLASPLRIAAEEEVETAAEPAGATRLAITGSAALTDLGPLGRQKFRLDLKVHNPLTTPLEVRGGDLLLYHAGGWLAPLGGDALDGGFFRGALTLGAGETRVVAGRSYVAPTPATHAVLAVDAADGTARTAIPILRAGYEPPPACSPIRPFGVGIVGPLEALPFSDGKTALLLIGQHQALSGPEPRDLVTTISLGSDKGSMEPITWKGVDAQGDRRALWPFVRRIEVFDGFAGGRLRLTARAVVDGRDASFSAGWPVRLVQPVVLRAPVLGRWQLSNGPGQADLHEHYVEPQHRYAYDMVVLRQGQTHTGDPHDNASYYAWNRSIRAAADGKVVHVCDSERDNPGYRGSLSTCHNNRVVLQHADGLYTAYLHIRRRSVPQGLQVEGAAVRAGQVIARVGNSGDSAEPHLHFMAFRVDGSGRVRSVPVSFDNAWHDAKGTQPVRGVPLGGGAYHFRNAR